MENIKFELAFQQFKKWLQKKSSLEKKNWYTLSIITIAVFALFVSIGGLIIAYLQFGKVEIISDKLSVYNPQKIETSTLSAVEIVETYFNMLKNQKYEESCGLETLRQCRYENPSEFLKYKEDKKRYWFTKLVNGEKLLYAWQYPSAKDGSVEYVCIRNEYQLSGENVPIQEIWEYKILTRPNLEKEIAYKECVGKYKNGKMTDGVSCSTINTKCKNSEPKMNKE